VCVSPTANTRNFTNEYRDNGFDLDFDDDRQPDHTPTTIIIANLVKTFN
jgi:hypothetical protein